MRPKLPEHAIIAAEAEALVHQILALPRTDARLLVAIAGPPASGKSTVAAEVARQLTLQGHKALHVPMDGFHLDNAILSERGLLHRKGAPETFDAAGFIHAMRRLSTEDEVVLPAFDRARDIAIAGVIPVDSTVRIAVVEGNYLAFDEHPWNTLVEIWDFCTFLNVPEEVLSERLVARWRDHGLDDEAAHARASQNDLPNARRILERRSPATRP